MIQIKHQIRCAAHISLGEKGQMLLICDNGLLQQIDRMYRGVLHFLTSIIRVNTSGAPKYIALCSVWDAQHRANLDKSFQSSLPVYQKIKIELYRIVLKKRIISYPVIKSTIFDCLHSWSAASKRKKYRNKSDKTEKKKYSLHPKISVLDLPKYECIYR